LKIMIFHQRIGGPQRVGYPIFEGRFDASSHPPFCWIDQSHRQVWVVLTTLAIAGGPVVSRRSLGAASQGLARLSREARSVAWLQSRWLAGKLDWNVNELSGPFFWHEILAKS
jgi:hypothetical protein